MLISLILASARKNKNSLVLATAGELGISKDQLLMLSRLLGFDFAMFKFKIFKLIVTHAPSGPTTAVWKS